MTMQRHVSVIIRATTNNSSSAAAAGVIAPTSVSHNATVNVPKRSISFDAMERVVGQYAANTFIESMTLNSKSIDTPLISVGDPSRLSSWEWSNCLDW